MLTERNRLVFEAAVEFVVASLSPGEPVPHLGDAVAVAEALAQRVFGPDGATSKTEVATPADRPFRRGDLVTVNPRELIGYSRSDQWRVTGFTGEHVSLVNDKTGSKLTVHESAVHAVPLVCPGHKVDLATRKCVHCGLTDKAIAAAGQTWSAAPGTAEPVEMNLGNAAAAGSAVSLEVKKPLPGWANDVYQAILRARTGGRIAGLRVLVDYYPVDTPFQLVVSVEDFLATFGLEGA